jgi:hypothetical protein
LSPFCAAALAAINRVATPSKRAIFIYSLKSSFSRGDDQWSRRRRQMVAQGYRRQAVVGKVRIL